MNQELVKVSNWLRANRLSLNISKTTYILFKVRKQVDILPQLILNNVEISRVQTTKFLGVTIDEKLNWSHHIKNVENKLASSLFIINKIKHKITLSTLPLLYDAVIHSNLIYCNLIWSTTYKKYTTKLIKLQKRALNLCFSDLKTPNISIFTASNRLSVQLIATYQILQLVHQFFYDPNILPLPISKLLKKINTVHIYNTKAVDDMNLFSHFSKTDIRKSCFKITAPVHWNLLPINIKQTISLFVFQKTLKVHLLKDHNK